MVVVEEAWMVVVEAGMVVVEEAWMVVVKRKGMRGKENRESMNKQLRTKSQEISAVLF